MQRPPPPISIVIPAYKGAFLAAALASLVAQTDRDFEVVIADDASPAGLYEICRPFEPQLKLRYLRFETNLGLSCLVDHWTRAVEAADHDWIWLMGDDDELEPGCLAALRAALAAEPDWPGLWHVDVVHIDAEGQPLQPARPFAPLLSAADYVRLRFQGGVGSFACEYLFNRLSWRERGGFLRFPLAWCSDDATWVRLAGREGIRTVAAPLARARWRLSGSNISAAGVESHPQKVEARLQYLEWLAGREAQAALALRADEVIAVGRQARSWFLNSLHATRTMLLPRQRASVVRRLSAATGGVLPLVALDLLRHQRWTAAAIRESCR